MPGKSPACPAVIRVPSLSVILFCLTRLLKNVINAYRVMKLHSYNVDACYEYFDFYVM